MLETKVTKWFSRQQRPQDETLLRLSSLSCSNIISDFLKLSTKNWSVNTANKTRYYSFVGRFFKKFSFLWFREKSRNFIRWKVNKIEFPKLNASNNRFIVGAIFCCFVCPTKKKNFASFSSSSHDEQRRFSSRDKRFIFVIHLKHYYCNNSFCLAQLRSL